MMKKYPGVMKHFYEFVPLIEDFSFMTVELAGVVFSDVTAHVSPLKIPQFHETVSFDVISVLMHQRNFNLCCEEAAMVIDYWSQESEFIALSAVEPRVWLLWKTYATVSPIHQIPEFPLDLFLEKFSQCAQSLKSYMNLLFAFVFDSEQRVWNEFRKLVMTQVDLHKNDFIEHRYMDEAMIEALNSRKDGLWREMGKESIERIKALIAGKRRFIQALDACSNSLIDSPDKKTKNQFWVVIEQIIKLAEIPLPHLSRESYLKSLEIQDLKTYREHYYSTIYREPVYNMIIPSWELMNIVHWTWLWKQLELLEVDFVYSKALVQGLKVDPVGDGSILHYLELIQCHCLRFKITSDFRWLAEIAYMSAGPMNSDLQASEKFMRTFLAFFQDDVYDFNSDNFAYMKNVLLPGIRLDVIDAFECVDERFIRFRLAPSELTREQVAGLMGNPQLKRLMLLFKRNASKLRYLDSFSAEDLIDFFPLSVKGTLDTCEALYTVNSDALAGFLKDRQGAINQPDVFIWWIHPDSWGNQRLTDQLAPLINYYSLIRYAKDAETFNLFFIMTDVVGQLERNKIINNNTSSTNNTSDNTSTNDASNNDNIIPPQVIIIKWLIQMEWTNFCLINIPAMENENQALIEKRIFQQFLEARAKALSRLIDWLNTNSASVEDSALLLQLVHRAPLCPFMASYIFSSLLFRQYIELNPSVKWEMSFSWERHSLYECFDPKAPLLKLRQIDLFDQVKQNSELCEELVLKYFRPIEKQIALYRLKLMNILGETRYSLNPTPNYFVYKLFKTPALPHSDLHVAFNVFTRLGLQFKIHHLTNQIDNLIVPPEVTKEAEKSIKNIQNIRSALVMAELQKLKSK